MKFCGWSILALFVLLSLAPLPAMAHHSIVAKFDDAKPLSLNGTLTMLDWKNPHVHVFMNVQRAGAIERWAIELESRVDLVRNGWTRESIRPGDALTVQGIAARDGSHQAWAKSVVLTSTGKKVFDVAAAKPPAVVQVHPVPRGPDGKPRLGSVPGSSGYWGYPSATSLM